METLIRHVTNLIHKDPSRSPIITGTRLLHQEHFEYRGASDRPEGLPTGSTRLSDAGAAPSESPASRESYEGEPANKRGPGQ